MMKKSEILQAIEYYEAKLPSIHRNESDATIASIQSIIDTLKAVVGIDGYRL